MIARILTTLSLVFAALSLGASATAIDTDVLKGVASPLEARAGLCCTLAVDNRWIQPVCQYMSEKCGGWGACLGEGNDRQWCRHCIVTHPEDPACTKLTWPPTDAAPVGKRSLDDTNTLLLEEVNHLNDDTIPGDGQIQKRQATQYVQTQHTPNVAQSFVRTFGRVTVRLVVSATNVVTYNIMNSGASEVVYEILDQTTNYILGQGTVESGDIEAGSSPNQISAQGGDRFEIDVN